jgi:hypothetical protein
LKQDLSRLLRATPGGIEEIEATMHENESLRKTLEETRSELRVVRTVAETAKPGVHSSSYSSKPGSKARLPSEIGQIANHLMQDVRDRDETIETQKTEIERLQRRVEETVRRLREAGAA